ncbi:hypothetical protein CEUSTIGMA_g10396.t1 [Chlamydomonas eustigma]|uniref:Telomere length regulation protein conserved domain-containing protein n=1 Tax=Chlamydomonas eustigma TaxID=1157962 RepID=A0A250XJ73_9CHLO|nr:hypothetical protein CEUSTIGMA_g10396.t1 [Chlamydomonas eustigma]|eukprot:GAX82969.1 hypothetical protein CEUSTIGMA_g10396.t1 [Chlamydomonas eustigma]
MAPRLTALTPLVRETTHLLLEAGNATEFLSVIQILHSIVLLGCLPSTEINTRKPEEHVSSSPPTSNHVRSGRMSLGARNIWQDHGATAAGPPARTFSTERLTLYANILIEGSNPGSAVDVDALWWDIYSEFYGQAFPHLADALLLCSSKFLSGTTHGLLIKSMVTDIFRLAPAPCALNALVGYLTTVSPIPDQRGFIDQRGAHDDLINRKQGRQQGMNGSSSAARMPVISVEGSDLASELLYDLFIIPASGAAPSKDVTVGTSDHGAGDDEGCEVVSLDNTKRSQDCSLMNHEGNNNPDEPSSHVPAAGPSVHGKVNSEALRCEVATSLTAAAADEVQFCLKSQQGSSSSSSRNHQDTDTKMHGIHELIVCTALAALGCMGMPTSQHGVATALRMNQQQPGHTPDITPTSVTMDNGPAISHLNPDESSPPSSTDVDDASYVPGSAFTALQGTDSQQGTAAQCTDNQQGPVVAFKGTTAFLKPLAYLLQSPEEVAGLLVSIPDRVLVSFPSRPSTTPEESRDIHEVSISQVINGSLIQETSHAIIASPVDFSWLRSILDCLFEVCSNPDKLASQVRQGGCSWEVAWKQRRRAMHYAATAVLGGSTSPRMQPLPTHEASSHPPTLMVAVVSPEEAVLATVSEDLIVALIERLCRRGMVRMVASAFLSFSQEGCATAIHRVLLRLMSSGGRCLERLIEEMLAALAVKCEYPTHLQPEELYVWARQHRRAQAAAEVSNNMLYTAVSTHMPLCYLLSAPPVLSHPELRYVLVDRLLLARTLPSPSLMVLLDLTCLLQAAGSSNRGGSVQDDLYSPVLEPIMVGGVGGDTRSLEVEDLVQRGSKDYAGSRSSRICGAVRQPIELFSMTDITARVAQVWGDAATLHQLPLTRQGYLSHCLALLLCRLTSAHLQQQQQPQQRADASSHLPGNSNTTTHPVRPAPTNKLILPHLVQGVSARLGSCLVSQRRQALRVGRIFSQILDPTSDLFNDQVGGLGWAEEELWEGAVSFKLPPILSTSMQQQDISHTAVNPSGLNQGHISAVDYSVTEEETDSDDDSEEEDAGSMPLPRFSVKENPEAEAWKRVDPKSLQLRSQVVALRKADDTQGMLTALSRLEVLVRACPDELEEVAPELVRALMHCRPPEWAQAEAKSPENSPETQRLRCLVALSSICPVPAGDTLINELYSPHLDTTQRLLILDTLSAAARELSLVNPSTMPRLVLLPGAAPRVEYIEQPSHQKNHEKKGAAMMTIDRVSNGAGPSTASPSHEASNAVNKSYSAGRGRTRIWGPVALRKRGEREPQAQRNRFVDVALRWAAGLLGQVDSSRPGMDLLHRDALLLGRLLATLASFSEFVANAPVALGLASACMELLKSPDVHKHQDAYVRRAALLAAGQVLASLPRERVAAALASSASSAILSDVRSSPASIMSSTHPAWLLLDSSRGRDFDYRQAHSGRGGGKMGSVADEVLLERLDWIQGWLREVASADMDETCRMMAEACVNIQAGLARQALQDLHHQERAQLIGAAIHQEGMLMTGGPEAQSPHAGNMGGRPLVVELAGSLKKASD